MVKQEGTAVGKVDANNPSQLLNKTLYHVLTDILSLELDDRHARWCHLLHAKDCDKWIRFEELNLSDFENMEYESNGDIIKFTEPDVILFLLFYMMTVLYIYIMTVSLHYISRLRANAHSF